MLRTTSKDSLKRSALYITGGDIKAATEIYEFFIKDMPNMPDYDMAQPTFMEQAKDTIGGVLGWVDQNQDKLVGYWQMIQSFKNGGGGGAAGTPMNLPPI